MEYLKSTAKVDSINMYWNTNRGIITVNLKIRDSATYFVPMNCDSDENLSDISDESIHYTVDAAIASKESKGKIINPRMVLNLLVCLTRRIIS